jgi:hypothetical protein
MQGHDEAARGYSTTSPTFLKTFPQHHQYAMTIVPPTTA